MDSRFNFMHCDNGTGGAFAFMQPNLAALSAFGAAAGCAGAAACSPFSFSFRQPNASLGYANSLTPQHLMAMNPQNLMALNPQNFMAMNAKNLNYLIPPGFMGSCPGAAMAFSRPMMAAVPFGGAGRNGFGVGMLPNMARHRLASHVVVATFFVFEHDCYTKSYC